MISPLFSEMFSFADLDLAGAAGQHDLARRQLDLGDRCRARACTSSASSSRITLWPFSETMTRTPSPCGSGRWPLGPPGAGPDRVVELSGLELDPHARADLRQHHQAVAVAGERRRRQRPAARLLAEHRRHRGADAAAVVRVVDVGDDAAVLAVVASSRRARPAARRSVRSEVASEDPHAGGDRQLQAAAQRLGDRARPRPRSPSRSWPRAPACRATA